MSVSVEVEGIKRVRGNHFRIRRDLIVTADMEIDSENKEAVFRNPRSMILHQGGKITQVCGFSKSEMEELRENIKTDGLNHPLTCRWVHRENHDQYVDPDSYENQDELSEIIRVQVVNGDRRLRCIEKLIKSKANVFSHELNDVAPAAEVYEFIDCIVLTMDPLTAFRYSYNGNDKTSPMGPTADVVNVRRWRQWGWTDEQILNVSGRKSSWLKDMDDLNQYLDETTFQSLANNEINLSIAKSLTRIENLEERLERLEQVKIEAIKRVTAKKEKLQSELEAAERRRELAEAEIAVAEHIGDDEGKAEAEEKKQRAEERRDEIEQEKGKLEVQPPKANSRDLDKTTGTSTSSEANPVELKPMTKNKLQKRWADPCAELISSQKKKDAEPIEDMDIADVRLTERLVNIIVGETTMTNAHREDVFKHLKEHKKWKERQK